MPGYVAYSNLSGGTLVSIQFCMYVWEIKVYAILRTAKISTSWRSRLMFTNRYNHWQIEMTIIRWSHGNRLLFHVAFVHVHQYFCCHLFVSPHPLTSICYCLGYYPCCSLSSHESTRINGLHSLRSQIPRAFYEIWSLSDKHNPNQRIKLFSPTSSTRFPSPFHDEPVFG